MLSNKVVIFGGSFNPPHFGHQAICFWLREVLDVTTIHLVPVYQHIFGKQLAPFKDRMEMCALATSQMYEYVRVSDAEKVLPAPNSTYNLLDYFKTLYGTLAPLVCVIGSDCLKDITKWHRWQELPNLAEFLVVDRPGSENVEAPFPILRYTLNVAPTSSSIIREKLANKENVEGLTKQLIFG